MRHHLALVLALGSSLVGCVAAPQPNPQTLSTRSPGGVWNDCLAAIERGVAGDRCSFDPEVTGTAESCASLLPPGIVGWETIGGQRVPIAETDLDVAAHCSDGRLVLNRVHEADPAPRSEPTIEASGCLSYTLPPELGENVRLCVEDDLLPELATSEDADLDRPGACEDVLDGVVLPGDVCTGHTICASVEAEQRYVFPGFTEILGRPGTYAWCGAGRVRRASGLVVMPCDHFDEERQTYVCALTPSVEP